MTEHPTEPKITQITISGMRWWRVDLPDGDFCYQPSEGFAISYARRWQVNHQLATDGINVFKRPKEQQGRA